MKLSRGDKVRITKGTFEGQIAIVLFYNRDHNTLTVAVDKRVIAPEDRRKFYVNEKGYVPVTLLEDEFEPVDKKVIIT